VMFMLRLSVGKEKLQFVRTAQRRFCAQKCARFVRTIFCCGEETPSEARSRRVALQDV
jgi:hypothetical protein